jgi:hypothetical protein
VGIFTVRIEVGDPQGSTFEAVDALVDTGSTNNAVPGSVLRRLGVTPQYKDQFELADNSLIELDVRPYLGKGERPAGIYTGCVR